MAETCSETPVSEGEEATFAGFVEEITAKVQAGEDIDVEGYVREHPEHAERLRQLLPAIQGLAEIGLSLPGEASSQPAAETTESFRGTLGDFRIVREVGRGGMGVVYEAEQISLKRQVALKVLPFAAVLDQKQLQRFKNEAQAAASLKHANIVAIHSVGCERAVHFYAMDYIEGRTLAQVMNELRQDPRLAPKDELAGSFALDEKKASGDDPTTEFSATPQPDASPSAETDPDIQAHVATEVSHRSPEFFRSMSRLGIQAAEALEHAHQMGVVHRDVKPSNLMIDNGGHLWITDFGLAMTQTETNLTMTGDVLGTLRYMSPQQAEGKSPALDHRTDVYSLGVTLYELLTLKPAFGNDYGHQLVHQILDGDLRPPRQLNPSIPRDLETIVLKATATEPEDRYATAQELADDLKRFLDHEPIRARRPSLVDRGWKWAGRHRPVVWAATATLVIALLLSIASTVLVAGAYQREKEQRQTADRNRQTADEQQQLAERNYVKAREAVKQMLTRVADENLAVIPEMKEVRRALLEDAVAFYTELLKLNPRDAVAYYERGRVNFLLLKYDEVCADYEKATELDPNNAEYHFALSHFSAYCPDGAYRDVQSAFLHIKWAVRLDPEDFRYHHDLAGAYIGQGEREKARAEMQKSADLCPSPAGANVYRAAACRAVRDLSGALKWEKKALELDPENPTIHDHLSWDYDDLGQYEKVIEATTKAIALAIKIRSESADFSAFGRRRRRGAAYARLGMYDEALADYDRAVELAPFRSFTYKRRAVVHFRLKNYDKALADIAKALELLPGDTSALVWIWPSEVAKCPDERFRDGLLKLADKAVELTDQPARARADRDRVRAALGRRREAAGGSSDLNESGRAEKEGSSTLPPTSAGTKTLSEDGSESDADDGTRRYAPLEKVASKRDPE